MQKKALKVGEFYARTTGTRKYGDRERIKILALDFPFERQVRRGYGRETETVIENDVQYVVVGDDGEPERYRYCGDIEDRVAEPQRLYDPKKVLHTWEAELADRRARQDQAAADAATRERNRKTALEQRDLILSFLGHPGSPLVAEIAAIEPENVWGSTTEVSLDITANAARLGDLLNLAYQNGFRRGRSED